MKKKLLICLSILILLVSCTTPFSGIKYYSENPLRSNIIFVSIEDMSKTIESDSYYIPSGYSGFLYNHSEIVKLGTIENKEIIKKSLLSKGYEISKTIDKAEVAVVFESSTTSSESVVNIGFYDAKSNDLIFLCKGRYGTGWTMQDDLNKALLKALESVPAF